MINTVLGEIENKKLGKTLCHEHIIIDLTKVRGDIDSALSNVDIMVDEISMAKESGVNTIIEVTNIGMGRNVKKLKEISEKSGVNIIASTGFYTIPYYPDYIWSKSPKELADIMIKEITEGIDGTNIKAGVIGEIGTSFNAIEPISLKVFEGAYIAHKATGVPIFTHCEIGTMGYEQALYFKNLGMDMNKLLIGHMDLVKDKDYLVKVLQTGANIAFDTIGKESYVTNCEKVKLISELIDLGYEDRIMLSQDVTRLSYLKSNGSFGYTEVCNKFIPLLRDNKIEENVIEKLIEKNIKRLFE